MAASARRRRRFGLGGTGSRARPAATGRRRVRRCRRASRSMSCPRSAAPGPSAPWPTACSTLPSSARPLKADQIRRRLAPSRDAAHRICVCDLASQSKRVEERRSCRDFYKPKIRPGPTARRSGSFCALAAIPTPRCSANSFAGMDAALETARRRAEVPTAATDQDNVASGGARAGLIGRNQRDPD